MVQPYWKRERYHTATLGVHIQTEVLEPLCHLFVLLHFRRADHDLRTSALQALLWTFRHKSISDDPEQMKDLSHDP